MRGPSPHFNIQTVQRLPSLLDNLSIRLAIEKLCGPSNTAVLIYEKSLSWGMTRFLAVQAGALPNSQPPTPGSRPLPVMDLI
jgi:hypothetical protein